MNSKIFHKYSKLKDELYNDKNLPVYVRSLIDLIEFVFDCVDEDFINLESSLQDRIEELEKRLDNI